MKNRKFVNRFTSIGKASKDAWVEVTAKPWAPRSGQVVKTTWRK